MKFLECDLEEIIMKTDNGKLCEKGLFIHGKKKNQLKIGNYGRLDVLTFEYGHSDLVDGVYRKFTDNTITIYELKKDKIGISCFLQAVSYKQGVKDYLISRGVNTINYNIRVVLIGRELDTSGSFCYLMNHIDWLSVYTYDYGVDGIEFNFEHGYTLINKGF